MADPGVAAAVTGLLRKRLATKGFSSPTIQSILSNFAAIIHLHKKGRRFKAYARMLLLHLKQAPSATTKAQIEASLFPKPRVLERGTSSASPKPLTCSIHLCPVDYKPVGCGGRGGSGKPTPGGVGRFCNKGGVACMGDDEINE